MPLRLLEMVLPEGHVGEIKELLKDEPVEDIWYDRISESQTLIKILAHTEETERLIDLLGENFSLVDGFRLILLPVAATLPRVEEPEEKKNLKPEAEKKRAERVSREELYAGVKEMARLSRVYLVMVALSTIVAALGLLKDNVAIVIGAMVIAPLLGPVIALAMATTLGDRDLSRLSLKANGAGLGLALLLSMAMGYLLDVNPHIPEIASRTDITLGAMIVALASGFAGALSFARGVSASLIGVMVAVALLPPLVAAGLLVGAGFLILGLGALLLTATNIICVNLAGVISFWVQGVRPTTWWEENIARRATAISVGTCVALLALLAGVILLSRRVGSPVMFWGIF
jgi:uncharacterized hydrophobic protein (TIGR00341 family)